MIFRFGASSLDTDRCELRTHGVAVPVEPQVFALIRLLVENRERLVGRDEVVEKIWNGRVVSDSAISSRLKSARAALGDDGERQQIIRTAPKLGFRFVAEVTTDPGSAAPRPEAAPAAAETPRNQAARPSIAVLPFTRLGVGETGAWMADALPHDLIAALSRLRWLFVIARGSSFRFRGHEANYERVREALQVRYCLSGVVETDDKTMTVIVELCDTHDGGVVWSERFRAPVAGVHEVREEIVAAAISALELEIPLHEIRSARLGAPGSLDAWSAYHLGLQQMYRFNREGTQLAAGLFEQAIGREPGFARAHAGLSFAHFENAFLGFADDPARSAALARRFAESGLEHDPLDPFCNMVMGRAHWLDGDLEGGLPWLNRAVRLNPNYAQARYSLAWTEALLGQGLQGRAEADTALRLSPLDPLAYGMLGVRAFSHMVQGEPAEAAEWGERAARSPGAHALIEMIAAVGHAMNDDRARAEAWVRSARGRSPGLSGEDFLRAFPFREPAMRDQVSRCLAGLGL